MPGLVGANIFIRRILFCPTCVADSCEHDAFQIAESFFHSPETACAECGLLCLHSEMMMRLLAARNQPLYHSLIEFLSSANDAISNQSATGRIRREPGHRPRNSSRHEKRALKARFNRWVDAEYC